MCRPTCPKFNKQKGYGIIDDKLLKHKQRKIGIIYL